MDKQVNSLLKTIKNATAARQLSVMMIITMITQVVTVYKSAIIAANFGAGVELDAYNFSNNLSTFFLTFVSSGITTVIIPSYVKKLDRKAIDTFLTIVFLCTGILIGATFLLRGQLVDIFTNREPEFRSYVCDVMMLTIWIQLLPAVLGVTTAYYQCIGRFTLPKVILLMSNLATVAVLTVIEEFNLYQYLYILLAGAVLQFAVDLACALHYGFRFKISFDIHNKVYRDLLRIFIPTLFSSGIYKINTLIDSFLSSNIGAGQLTILSYSHTIVGMVNTLIIGNLITYVYPKIVATIGEGKEASQTAMWKYAVSFHIAVCLIVVGFVSVGREFIGLLYEHGQFTDSAASSVYLCMCIYMFAQQNNIVRDLVYRYFFAVGDTKSTVYNGLMTNAINIIMSVTLVGSMGVYGIVFGTLVAGACSLAAIIVRFRYKFSFAVSMKPVFFRFVKTEIVVLVSIAFVLILKEILPQQSDIIALLFYGAISVAVYGSGVFCVHRRWLRSF